VLAKAPTMGAAMDSDMKIALVGSARRARYF
jgi:hypothetical protein